MVSLDISEVERYLKSMGIVDCQLVSVNISGKFLTYRTQEKRSFLKRQDDEGNYLFDVVLGESSYSKQYMVLVD